MRLCECGAELVRKHAKARWPKFCATCALERKRASNRAQQRARAGDPAEQARDRQRYWANVEAQRERSRRYYASHREQRAAYDRQRNRRKREGGG